MAGRNGALRVDLQADLPAEHSGESAEHSEGSGVGQSGAGRSDSGVRHPDSGVRHPGGGFGRPDSVCPVPDEVLVDRIRAGQQGAFDEIYQRYFPRVFHFVARRLRNRSDAEETVQEVFFNIFASIDSFRGEAPFGAWVFGLARRTVSSRFKKRMPLLVPLGDDDVDGAAFHAATHEPDPHQLYECGERLARLEGAVANELSDEQRHLFELHHLEHRSIQEIAGLLSKSEDAIKSHLYRARRVLLAR
jgi:RNA polymerase sigma-70 factor (ECF subfamily)